MNKHAMKHLKTAYDRQIFFPTVGDKVPDLFRGLNSLKALNVQQAVKSLQRCMDKLKNDS